MDINECNLNLNFVRITVFSFQVASLRHQLFKEDLQKRGMYILVFMESVM